MTKDSPRARSALLSPVFLGLLLAVALVASGYFMNRARVAAGESDRALRALEIQMVSNQFGAAALTAERGDFDGALPQTTRVFQRLDAMAARDGRLPKGYQPLADQRDAIVAALARGDSTVGRLMTDLYLDLVVPLDPAAMLSDLPGAVSAGGPAATPRPPQPRALVSDSAAAVQGRSPIG